MPIKVLGINRDSNGNIVLGKMEVPTLQQMQGVASKFNMLASNNKSDYTSIAKMLNNRRTKTESTNLTSPNLGNSKDWLFVGISDTSIKMEAAAVIHWSSKTITGVVSNSLAAEKSSPQQMVKDCLTKG